MGVILPVLLALNIIAASVATPVFVSGMGLGGGGGGSSFKQSINSKASGDLEAALALIKLSCDESAWNKNKSKGEPAFPKNTSEARQLFDSSKSLGIVRFNELCKPLDNGQSGIVFYGGSNQISNGEEMFHLFARHWDRRVLNSIYYEYQKRFSAQGYAVSCKESDKMAPIMSLKVSAGFMSEDGSPTALAKARYEDDPEASDEGSFAVSPHGRGQAVDFITLGCTKIIQQNELKQIVPNAIATGQDDKSQMAESPNAEALAAQTSGSDQEDIKSALKTSADDDPTFYETGLGEGEREGLGATEVASGIPDPDAEPEFIPHHDPPADLPNDTSGAIPEPSRQNSNRPSFEERSSQFFERVIEKKYSLPPGALAKGADLETIGRKALFSQAGISLSEKPSKEEIAASLASITAHQSPSVSILVPDQAIAELKKGDYSSFTKIVGMNRLNLQFSLGYSDNQISQLASKGINGKDLGLILSKKVVTNDKFESRLVDALSSGGYKALSQELQKVEEEKKTSATGGFADALKNSPELSREIKEILGDFLSDKNHRSGVPNRLKLQGAGDQLIKWTQTNQNLSDQDTSELKGLFDSLKDSSNPKSAIKNLQPSVYESIIKSSIALMSPQEQTIFLSIFGANPSSDELRKAFSSGKLEQAAEAYVISRGLEKAGLPSSQSTYLAVSLASDRSNGTSVGLALFNKEIGSKYNITLGKNDLTLFKNGNFEGAKKLAFSVISKKIDKPLQTVISAFTGKDSASKNEIVSALKSNPALADKTKAMLDGILQKHNDNGEALAATASSLGAKAKAKSLANASSSSEADRKSNSERLEAAFDGALAKGRIAAKAEGKQILMQNGLNEAEANTIMSGQLKGAEKTVVIGKAAQAIASKTGADPELVKKAMSGNATAQERAALGDSIAASRLGEFGITTQVSITDTIINGTDRQREELASDLGRQYGAFVLQQEAAELEPPVSITRDQAMEFMQGDFSELGDVAGQSVVSNGLSRITGVEISPEAAGAMYTAVRDLFDSPDPVAMPSASGQVGIDASGSNSGDAALSGQQGAGSDLPSGPPGSSAQVGDSQSGAQAPTADSTTSRLENTAENIGWGFIEDNFGFSKDTIKNFETGFKDLPNNIIDSYRNFDYNGAMSSIGAGVIVGTLIGEQLAKIDPTGGLLTSYAMSYATSFITSLGISAPILLGIAFIINPEATLQAIKSLVMTALMIFKDPVSAILGFLGFGKKPKAKSAVNNPSNANKDKIKNPSSLLVDTPPENSGGSMTVLADKAVAATSATSDSSNQVSASSSYLPAKKPSKEYFKKISRRTTDQLLEDLLLQGVIFSRNGRLNKLGDDFINNHWSSYMKTRNPQTLPFAVKQIISPRAIVDSSQKSAANKKGINDIIFEKEYQGGMTGIVYLRSLSKLVFGDKFDSAKTGERNSGLLQNRSIKTHVHLSF